MRLGLIVNPIAGVGGAAALQGSDGPLSTRALALGAVPRAGERAALALSMLVPGSVRIVTADGAMGADAAAAAGHRAEVAYRAALGETTAADTARAIAAIVAEGCDLIAFAGGDGTARDGMAALDSIAPDVRPPVIGIPAGVKMLSGAFATSPRAAGAMLASWAAHGVPPARLTDVLDRHADGTIVLHGALAVPPGEAVQAAKARGDGAPGTAVLAAARALADELRAAPLAIVGPGATMLAVKHALAGTGTLLGVDAYAHGTAVAIDADAATLLALSESTLPRIALGVIGGQGSLIGRGNQPIGPALLSLAGRAAIDVVAAQDKLAALLGGCLWVDTGDPALDDRLAGHIAVRTAPRKRMMMPLRAG